MTAERLDHLLALDRAALPADQRCRGEKHAGRAEAALRGIVLVEGHLDVREMGGISERLDRRDLGAVQGRDDRQARPPRLPVDEYRAAPATAVLATRLGADQPELLP